MIGRFIILVLILAMGVARGHAAPVTLDQLSLLTKAGAIHVGSEEVKLDPPPGPVMVTHIASGGISEARSSYDIDWDEAGRFDLFVGADHASQGSIASSGSSTGHFLLTPSVDSQLLIDIRYNYALGDGERKALARVHISRPNDGILFEERLEADSAVGDPLSGEMLISRTIPLFANEVYNFGYGVSVTSQGGSPTVLSLGNGLVRLSVIPIPEPGTIVLLLVAASFATRRSRSAR